MDRNHRNPLNAIVLDIILDDAEHDRTAASAQVVINVVTAAQRVLTMVDEPHREYEPEELPPRNHEYFIHLGDPTFRNDFRMTRVLFEELYTTLAPHMDRMRHVKIDGKVQLMMALWIMATPDSFRSVGRRFGVQRATVHFIYLRVLGALNAVADQFIRWPSLAEQEVIRGRFLRDRGPFPGVVGVVDGCNIEIKKPQEHPVAFYDRKGRYSVKLQAVCDDTLQFRDVYVGECGSLNDPGCFSRSPLAGHVLDERVFPADCHILGDAAYTVETTCMVPFKRLNRRDLTERQRNFNYVLSKSRVTIENAFARLQTKWRRFLVDFDVSRLDYAVRHIMACCVLHNFIIRGGESHPEPDEEAVANQIRMANLPDEDQAEFPDDDEVDEEEEDPRAAGQEEPAALAPLGRRARALRANAKRNRIAAQLPMLLQPRRVHEE